MGEASRMDGIRAAWEELDAIVEEIQGIPGYEDFLAVPTFDEVAETTRERPHCPLVYLAAAESEGLALVVRGDEVTHVPLDSLTATELRERTTDHLARYTRYQRERTESPEAAGREWNAALDEVTAWLWREVMGPVLEAVDGEEELAVVAGGLLGLLPLHAAWTPDPGRATGRRYVLDTVAVSYVPNARVLRTARQLAAQLAPSRLLAVVDPWPTAAAPLRMARHEAAVAAAAFPASQKLLTRGEATFLSFEWEAPKADVWHLACHGFAAPTEPLESGLVLAGGPVRLRRLMEWRLRVRLAVLSACETAVPGTELPDEVVALPTGLLQAGVAGVVASQWAVPDRATAMLMAEFYRQWLWLGQPPAAALRAAQRWLRDTTTAEKRTHFAAALDEGADWLPASAGQAFLDRLDLDPDGRAWADIQQWGAFAHFGA